MARTTVSGPQVFPESRETRMVMSGLSAKSRVFASESAGLVM
ncbi:hypothetical protein ACIHEJ_17010 [Streptomyces sp. NPDC052301]